ncbi:30S ribosomal protein S16 [Candidatus Peregrinibacteria bacterium CG10_big_fil_rev_8_21_14_0_10_55_24]|nr:MAG: 30S ribosomal protein S16 [Candidatus Peregrinibacteria bacterium CG10_big_fil_rev_8_21_14_0_10_55_24]
MLVIRLQRTGKRNDATYRVVVAEKSAAVKGGYLELLGYYLPTRDPEVFECDTAKVQEWVNKGAQPSNTLARLLKKHGLKDMDAFIVRYAKQRRKKAPAEGEAPAPETAAATPKAPALPAEEKPSAPVGEEPTKVEEEQKKDD